MSFNKEISNLSNLFVAFSDADSFFHFLTEKKNEKEIKIEICEIIFDLYNIECGLRELNNLSLHSDTSNKTLINYKNEKINNKRIDELYPMWVERFYLYKEFYDKLLTEYSLFLINRIQKDYLI